MGEMDDKIVKRILFFWLILIVIFSVNPFISYAAAPPNTVIMNGIVSGEVNCYPLKMYVMAKKSIKLYTMPYYDSAAAGYLNPHRLSKITNIETHCFPYKNVIEIDGCTAYMLMYRGEGYYSVWLDGQIIDKYMKTNQIDTGERLWIKIKNPDTGNEGWINYADYGYESFFHDIGSGIFLDPAHLYDLK
jgi:hypothetical protein